MVNCILKIDLEWGLIVMFGLRKIFFDFNGFFIVMYFEGIFGI